MTSYDLPTLDDVEYLFNHSEIMATHTSEMTGKKTCIIETSLPRLKVNMTFKRVKLSVKFN